MELVVQVFVIFDYSFTPCIHRYRIWEIMNIVSHFPYTNATKHLLKSSPFCCKFRNENKPDDYPT